MGINYAASTRINDQREEHQAAMSANARTYHEYDFKRANDYSVLDKAR